LGRVIRPVREEELPEALQVLAAAFDMTVRAPSVHTLVAGSADGNFFVAERDGRIVGTGASVAFGTHGWLGGIAVADEARGSGVGGRLTQAAIEALGEPETILLLASDLGRPIYDRLGFEPECRYPVFAGTEITQVRDGVRPATPADREAILALDEYATGERRTLALDVSLDGALVTEDLAGVALKPPFPALPIIARTPEAGAALLAATLAPGLRLAVPETNPAAIAALHALGAEEVRSVTRMHRGPAIAWRPEWVWGVFSLFFG
jgi:predicted N-acetyltransferase YhbS